jgi:hypothetical protein
MLKLGHSPSGIREPCRLNIIFGQTAIIKGKLKGFPGHLFDAFIIIFSKLDHSCAQDINIITHGFPFGLNFSGDRINAPDRLLNIGGGITVANFKNFHGIDSDRVQALAFASHIVPTERDTRILGLQQSGTRFLGRKR